jgi:hypothetical protein
MNYKIFLDDYASNLLKADPLKAIIAFSKRIPTPCCHAEHTSPRGGLKICSGRDVIYFRCLMWEIITRPPLMNAAMNKKNIIAI